MTLNTTSMQIQIAARSLKLTKAQQSYIEDKISHLAHLGKELEDPANLARVEVDYQEVDNAEKRIKVEITLKVPNKVIRASQTASNLEEATDLVEKRLRSQIEHYRGKMHKNDKTATEEPIPVDEFDTLAQAEFDSMHNITKRKRFSLVKQMNEEEAIRRMNEIGHDFFLFWNKESNRFSVVYRREGGSYGIIEPKIETNKAGETEE